MEQSRTASRRRRRLLQMAVKRDPHPSMDATLQSRAPVTQVSNPNLMEAKCFDVMFRYEGRFSYLCFSLIFLHSCRALNEPSISKLSGVCAFTTCSEPLSSPLSPTGGFFSDPGGVEQPPFPALHLLCPWTPCHWLLLGQRNQGQPFTA